MSANAVVPTVLVVANPLGTDLIAAYLSDVDPSIGVVKAASMAQAEANLEAPRPLDLLLFYLHLPEANGLRGFRRLRERSPRMPMAVLSSDVSAETVYAAQRAGACGFLSMGLQGPAFVAALRLLLAGERYFPATLLQEAEGSRSARGDITDTLTPRELETLEHLSQGRSNKEIATAMNIEIVTVTLHLSNLYRKLGVTGRLQAVRLATDAGIGRDSR